MCQKKNMMTGISSMIVENHAAENAKGNGQSEVDTNIARFF